MKTGPVKLLLIQTTPFCNINCDYCYLPDRNKKGIITLSTVEKIFQSLVDEKLLANEVSIGWHSGEPLVVGIDHYQDIFKLIREIVPSNIHIKHNIQTNGTLIDQDWCDFIKGNNVQLGVSIDGPGFIHDNQRLTRNKKGTFEQVMRGVNLLQKNNINFGVISVLTRKSINYPKEIYDFLCELDCTYICFNIDEKDGQNTVSTLEGFDEEIKNFWASIYYYQLSSPRNLKIRELDKLKAKILKERTSDEDILSMNNKIFEILSVDKDGNFSTFSPELIGQKNITYNNFILGNVYQDSYRESLKNPKFEILYNEIISGIERCRNQCHYFDLCGGGSPSSKLYENGTFNSTETNFCKATTQYPIDVIIEKLEQELRNIENSTILSEHAD